ncbi:MAG: nucleotide sugar dehydrogenase [Knoellia sp.]
MTATHGAPPSFAHSARALHHVAVVGIGYVGACLAAVLAESCEVTCIDSDADVVAALQSGRTHIEEPGLDRAVAEAVARGRLTSTLDPEAIGDASVILLTVGTPIATDGSIDPRQLQAACRAIAPFIQRGQLVVVKSTVPPGTTRQVIKPLLEAHGLVAGVDFALSYCPERLAEATALTEVRTLPVVVSGIDEDSRDAAVTFWSASLGVPTLAQRSLEAAEIVKLADNWWIDVNLALANELAKFCDLYEDVDVLDVVSAANSITKGTGSVNILRPSVGVGGSCLTKDPWMVWRTARDHGLELASIPASRGINDAMPAYVAGRILTHLAARTEPRGGHIVAVLGAAFKNNTGDLRATPVKGVVDALCAAGVEVRIFDPLVDPREVTELMGITPSETVEEATDGAHCLAVLALHDEMKDVELTELPVAPDCLVVDGRAYYPPARIAELERHGYRYQGVGR